MSAIASSTSRSPRASARPPRWSTPSGNATPDPRMSVIAPSPEADLGRRDRHGRGSLELDAGGLERDCAAAFDDDVRARLELQLAARLQSAVSVGLLGPRALGRDAEVATDLEDDVLGAVHGDLV